MSRIRYERSFWIDRVPRSRQPAYPSYRGAATTDVAIVGGGLTGCLAAYLFVQAGLRVVLLEAERIGQQSTGGSLGVLWPHPAEAPFATLQSRFGLRAARTAWTATRRAALDLAALLRRLRIRCDLTVQDVVELGLTPEQVRALERERKLRLKAGMEALWANQRALQAELRVGRGGIRAHGGATVDPYRACLGVAHVAAARGAALYERSRVHKVRFSRRDVEITTDRGRLRALNVAVATGVPGTLYRSLQRHVAVQDIYTVVTPPLPPSLRRQFGTRTAVARDADVPPHRWRWTRDGRVVFQGAEQRDVPARARGKVIVQRTGQLMYELSRLYPGISGIQPDYGWATAHAMPPDGLPLAGRHRAFRHHLFAFGLDGCGLGGAYLAARILVRAYLGRPEKGDEVFGLVR